jgi:hypothetical protein
VTTVRDSQSPIKLNPARSQRSRRRRASPATGVLARRVSSARQMRHTARAVEPRRSPTACAHRGLPGGNSCRPDAHRASCGSAVMRSATRAAARAGRGESLPLRQFREPTSKTRMTRMSRSVQREWPCDQSAPSRSARGAGRWLSRGPAWHRLGLGLVRLWVMTRQGRGRCRGDVALRSGREVAGRCLAAAPVQWARWAPGAQKGKGLL